MPLAYLDDILVYSQTRAHLWYLNQVFQRLQAADLRINPQKCKLGFTQLDYLGYTIGEGKIRPQLKKVEAIQKAVQPQMKKQLRQFLGMAGYYSRFIPHYAAIATPLTDR